MPPLPYLENAPKSEKDWLETLVRLARYLRGPDGCPWDRARSARDFAEDAYEEAGELIEAYDHSDNAHICEELGDTLFVLLASAVGAETEGRFTLEEVLINAHNKMVRRHDHVFGEQKATTAEEALASWNRMKANEKPRT